MAAKFRKDDVVSINKTTITGVVISREVVEDDDLFLVRWVDAETGDSHERKFQEDQLTGV